MSNKLLNSLIETGTGRYVFAALIGIAGIVAGFGQACSPSGSTTGATTLNSATSTAATSAASLSVTPTLTTVVYGSSTQLSVSGGTAPYVFHVTSGGGTIGAANGLFLAPQVAAKITIEVIDSLGATGYSVLTSSATAAGTSVSVAKVFTGSYVTMNSLFSGCTQDNPYGADCDSAIRLACQGAGYGTGFGPVEHGGDSISYACIINGAFVEKYINFSALTYYNSSCTEANAMSAECASATSRYCIATGSPGGHGPIAFQTDKAVINCMANRADIRLVVSFAALTAQHSSCVDSVAYSDVCFAAVDRYCHVQGYVSGYGIVEHGNGTAAIDCVP